MSATHPSDAAVFEAEAPESALRARSIRSFVKREGRITVAQELALARLWTRYGIGDLDFEASTAGIPRLDPAVLFGRRAPLGIEIGFGSGDHLAALAGARPEMDFIGIEVHRPGVGRLLHRAEALGLGNLRVACTDAVELLRDSLPAGAVDEVLIYFPDPWPKKRHHKRRIIQPAFAKILAGALRSGGRLRLATDWADYAVHMRDVLDADAEFENIAGEKGFIERPLDRPLTRFEARGLRLGHAVFDLEYRRR